jgi:hypothetical protein
MAALNEAYEVLTNEGEQTARSQIRIWLMLARPSATL